jgi:hypothetical protein
MSVPTLADFVVVLEEATARRRRLGLAVRELADALQSQAGPLHGVASDTDAPLSRQPAMPGWAPRRDYDYFAELDARLQLLRSADAD